MKAISSIVTQYNEATAAYKRAMQASKNIKPEERDNQDKFVRSTSEQSILRKGDDLDLRVNQTSAPSFSEVVNKLFKAKVKKIEDAEVKSLDAIKGKVGMVEVMNAVNDSEIVLQQIVTVRDKFVNAYLEILKMPL